MWRGKGTNDAMREDHENYDAGKARIMKRGKGINHATREGHVLSHVPCVPLYVVHEINCCATDCYDIDWCAWYAQSTPVFSQHCRCRCFLIGTWIDFVCWIIQNCRYSILNWKLEFCKGKGWPKYFKYHITSIITPSIRTPLIYPLYGRFETELTHPLI